jgi:O-antigen/teichoic acid export membrane protein
MAKTPSSAALAGSAGDMLFGMGSKLLYAATRVALPPLALAHMGLSDYGLWSTCFVLVSYLGMAASGFTLIYLRSAARHHAQGDTAAIGRLLSTGMLAMGGLAALLLAGLWGAMPMLLDLFRVAPDQRALASDLWLGAAAVFLADMSLGAFANVLHAIGRLRQEQKVWVAAFVLEAVLIVGLLGAGWGVRGLLAAFAGRYLFSASANAWLACRALPGLRLSWRGFDRSLLRGFFVYGASMQASGLISTALASADRLLAGLFIGPQATALTDLASKLPVTAAGVTGSAAGVAVSAAARCDAGGHTAALRGVYDDATRITVASLALSMPLLSVFAPTLMTAWLGPGPAQAAVAPLMTWLVLGLHAHLLTGPLTSVARGRGQLGADFVYHGLRATALTVAVVAWQHAGPAGLPGFMQALVAAQVLAATVFLAAAHRRLCGGWSGLGSRVLAPTVAAYALTLAASVLLPAQLATTRLDALAGLAAALLLSMPPLALLLAGCLMSHDERRRALQRVRSALRPLIWRSA